MHPMSAIATNVSNATGTQVAEQNVVQRAAAILRDEIAAGALANIAESSRIWQASRAQTIGGEVIRHLRTDLEQMVDTVLDLLAPRASTVMVLRSPSPVACGQTAVINTRLANDTIDTVELRFVCSDLVAEPDGRIPASCVQVSPAPVHLPAGQVVDLAISLCVPAEAPPGQYRAVLQATDLAGLRALLSVPVV